MKAVGFYRSLPIEQEESLLDLEIERPVPSGRDLLVQVRAISVNPVDVKQRVSHAQPETTPCILGWDVAGTVIEVGQECTLFQPGEDVYYAGSLIRPGGNCAFHLVDERLVGHKPRTLDFAQAAALPLTAITAWEGLFERLGISRHPQENAGKAILIIGAAGGVGSIATQLARLAGLAVIGAVARPESEQWTREHGATHIITRTQPFVPQLQALNLAAVESIFCLNDPDEHWENMVSVLAPQGRICSILPPRGPVDFIPLFQKSATFVFELMFTRSLFHTADMSKQHTLLEELARLVDAGHITSTLAERLEPINAATLRAAHAKIERGQTVGKIVLERFP